MSMMDFSSASLNCAVKYAGKSERLFQPVTEFTRNSCQFKQIIWFYTVIQVSRDLCRNRTLDVQEEAECSSFTAPSDWQHLSTVNTTNSF